MYFLRVNTTTPDTAAKTTRRITAYEASPVCTAPPDTVEASVSEVETGFVEEAGSDEG